MSMLSCRILEKSYYWTNNMRIVVEDKGSVLVQPGSQ